MRARTRKVNDVPAAAQTGWPTDVVHQFRKNANEIVFASMSVFKGQPYADLRVYVPSENGQGTPTRKGLTIHVDLLDELAAAVAALRKAVGAQEGDG